MRKLAVLVTMLAVCAACGGAIDTSSTQGNGGGTSDGTKRGASDSAGNTGDAVTGTSPPPKALCDARYVPRMEDGECPSGEGADRNGNPLCCRPCVPPELVVRLDGIPTCLNLPRPTPVHDVDAGDADASADGG